MQSTLIPLRAMLCVALPIFLAGCEVIEDFFRAQGTIIFATHNRVMGMVIGITEDLLEKEDFEAADELYEIEDNLFDACEPLLQVSSLAFDSIEADDELKEEAFKSFDSCEKAASEAEAELYRIAPEEANSYP